MQTIIYLDFEAYSPIPIEEGSKKYTEHPEANIVFLGYKINDQPTKLWIPGDPVPKEFKNSDIVLYAHNALFDYRIWNNIGALKYGFPRQLIKHWRDSMSLCGRYMLPLALDKACKVINKEHQKLFTGRALIKKISCLTKDGRRPELHRDFSLSKYQQYGEYCCEDTEAMYELITRLPSDKLSDIEQNYWLLTQQMNEIGLPIDTKAVAAILNYVSIYIEEQTVLLPEITNGQITKATQAKRIKDFCEANGHPIPNLQAETVNNLLATDNEGNHLIDLPDQVRTILMLRQELGKTSTAKYKKLQALAYNGWVYDNLCYYGAGPGRWSGRGFQMHNLPRASVENPNKWIEKFINIEEIDDPVQIAKALIRSMIRAPRDFKIIVSDYSSIENRNLHWFAFDEDALQLFRDGRDQYIDMAAFLYNRSYDYIKKGYDEGDKECVFFRLIGKIIILGCGYGMGPDRFKAEAASWGVIITLNEARLAVDAYRMKYKLVRKMWYDYSKCCMAAIRNPGQKYEVNRCVFYVVTDKVGTKWLCVLLPSGRVIYYMDPQIIDGRFGDISSHMGVDPYSKQWVRKELIPGRITENIDQGFARDIMANGLINIQEKMKEVTLIGTVHDEGLGLIADRDITDNSLETFSMHLCDCSFAPGLPLKANGFIEERYRK